MTTDIQGVGPETPSYTLPNGAKQSALPYRVDLVPAKAILDVSNVLHKGAEKYGVDNWRGIPSGDHLNHALTHIFAYLAGDRQDNHLGHAACRMLMAHEQDINSR